MTKQWQDHHTLILDTGEFAYDAPKLKKPPWMQSWECDHMGRRFWQRGKKCQPRPFVGMSGVQAYERPGFIFGGGLYAPGGPGGGTTFAPARGPSQCHQVPGGVLRCVMPALGPGGLQKEKGWPPEIGPEEERLLDQGCRPTGRRCGGSTRAPAQYWCCPGGPLATIVGSPTLIPGLLGDTEARTTSPSHLAMVAAALIGGFAMHLWSEAKK